MMTTPALRAGPQQHTQQSRPPARQQKMTPTMMIARPTSPPTTPPTMAPVSAHVKFGNRRAGAGCRYLITIAVGVDREDK
jgi:hypothetical protein